jgi:DNA (cytosine-5)-methyltransferase 1
MRAPNILCHGQRREGLSDEAVVGKSRLRSLELFTGAGGLALGTSYAGFEHVAFVENDVDACATLGLNAKLVQVLDRKRANLGPTDITEIQDFREFLRELGHGAEIDLVAGGPPCQPFSGGGLGRGPGDHRDRFPNFIQAVRDLRPSAFIIENVQGLRRPALFGYFEYLKRALRYPSHDRGASSWEDHDRKLKVHETVHAPDYDVQSAVLNAADYGVPQVRNRLFIVGYIAKMNIEWKPRPGRFRKRLLEDALASGEYFAEHDLMVEMDRRGKVARPNLPLPLEPDTDVPVRWRTVRDMFGTPERLPPLGTIEAKKLNHVAIPGARAYPGHTGSPLDWPAKTIKAGVHGVPGGENMVQDENGLRYFTVRETARLQGFPDEWQFDGSWTEVMRQLGNAVPVDLAAAVAQMVVDDLKSVNQQQRDSQSRLWHRDQRVAS